MTTNTLHAISTIFVMIAFFGVCWWAFSPKRRKGFKDAANLPFSDEKLHKKKVADKKPENSSSEESE